MQAGMADAWADFGGVLKQFNEGKVTSGDVFGTRADLKNNYLYRMAAAVLGIYGNSKAGSDLPNLRRGSRRPEADRCEQIHAATSPPDNCRP